MKLSCIEVVIYWATTVSNSPSHSLVPRPTQPKNLSFGSYTNTSINLDCDWGSIVFSKVRHLVGKTTPRRPRSHV